MKAKFVAESIEEAWVSTDTGAELYLDNTDNDYNEEEDSTQGMDISSMIPPPTIKLDSEDFEMFVNQLIEIIPENPMIAVELFRRTIQQHPYLTRKTIGFMGKNPYEDTIDKFINIINHKK